MRSRSDRRLAGMSVEGPWWFRLLTLPLVVVVTLWVELRDLIESAGWPSLIAATIVMALLAGAIVESRR